MKEGVLTWIYGLTTTGHVGTAAFGCLAEQSSAPGNPQKQNRHRPKPMATLYLEAFEAISM
jgi:hypothetical protein